MMDIEKAKKQLLQPEAGYSKSGVDLLHDYLTEAVAEIEQLQTALLAMGLIE